MNEMIGKYKVLQLLGRGGMAEAYKVQLSGPAGFERLHCIKKIRSDYAENIDFIKSFESEARIISRLLHPNIVQVFELIQDNGLCLVMEYIDGMDLNDVLKTTQKLGLQVPIDFSVYILESLLLALHHAHTLKVGDSIVPVIHRDISPHNILLSTGGVAKLADFGIAKAMGMSEATKTGVLKGKLAYMSPEQTKGGKSPIGPQSDLFAAGVVFWEMLAKDRLFKASTEHQVLANIINFQQAPIDHLSLRVNDFLARILAPDVDERFQSAQEALTALKSIGLRPCTQTDAGQIVTELKNHVSLRRIHEKTRVATNPSMPATLIGDPLSETYCDENTEVSNGSGWSSTRMEKTMGSRIVINKKSLLIPVLTGIAGFLVASILTVMFTRGEDIQPMAPGSVNSDGLRDVFGGQPSNLPRTIIGDIAAQPVKEVSVPEKSAVKPEEEKDTDESKDSDSVKKVQEVPTISPKDTKEKSRAKGQKKKNKKKSQESIKQEIKDEKNKEPSNQPGGFGVYQG